jgi:acyl-CoA synthetase (NDP forming)
MNCGLRAMVMRVDPGMPGSFYSSEVDGGQTPLLLMLQNPKPGTQGNLGAQTMRQLLGGGFTGSVYPVNPGHDFISGIDTFGSVEEIPETVDLVVLAVANQKLESEMEKVVRIRARSVAIFASCHGEATDGSPLRDRIRDMANGADIPICGGNGMGFLNIESSLRVCGFHQPLDLNPGGITFLSHSGSLFSAMLHNRRGLAFNLVVSTGLEMNTTMDQYLNWALGQDTTKAVGLFLETVRNPAGLRAALSKAEDSAVPVVALKAGTTGRGQSAVATHSGAIAGEDAACEALFRHHGVLRVETMDEMADTLELLTRGRPAANSGLGAVHDSGGERVLLIDTAERVGVPLPAVSPQTRERLAELLDPGLEPENPVDAWGTGRDASEVFVETITTLAEDPAIGAIAFCVDLTTEERLDDAYSAAAIKAASLTTKPVMVIANLSTTVDPEQANALRGAGVPVLEGTETALRAVRHLFDRHERSLLPPIEARLTDPNPTVGSDTWGLLDAYGVRTPKMVFVADETDLVEVARKIGFPVVLKTTAVDHKTESDGVVLGITHEDELVRAYHDMRTRLGEEVVVSEQIPAGVELGVGMINDPQFGPVVLVSAGGTMIELLGDRIALLPPFDSPRLSLAMEELAIRPLLDGYRGAPAADVEAVADLVVRFSEMVVDHRDRLISIDLNPVICGPTGAVAVDAMAVMK